MKRNSVVTQLLAGLLIAGSLVGLLTSGGIQLILFVFGGKANDSLGSAYADEVRHQLIAQMIPALSLPAGANTVPSINNFGNGNYDMNTQYQSGWPSSRGSDTDWRHNDVREVSYTYTFRLFDAFVTYGGLNQ